MTRHIDPIAAHACPGDRKLDPRWGLRGCGKHESEGLELGFNLHRYPSFPSSHSSGKQHASRCIEAAGGDPSHIRLFNFVKWRDSAGGTHLSSLTFSDHLLPFVETIARTCPTLVIIDPLLTILGSRINASNDQQIRETFRHLTNLARSTNCTFLIVRHLNKGSSGNPLYQGGGSIGIIGTVRTGLLVTQHPADEKQRLLVAIKNNSSEKASNLTYQVIANERGIPSIQWLGANNYPVAPLLRPVSSLSFERQDILKVLQAANRPLSPKELAAQTGQDHTLLRQLLRRMLNAGDIISPAYGLYTTPHHLSPEK